MVKTSSYVQLILFIHDTCNTVSKKTFLSGGNNIINVIQYYFSNIYLYYLCEY